MSNLGKAACPMHPALPRDITNSTVLLLQGVRRRRQIASVTCLFSYVGRCRLSPLSAILIKALLNDMAESCKKLLLLLFCGR